MPADPKTASDFVLALERLFNDLNESGVRAPRDSRFATYGAAMKSFASRGQSYADLSDDERALLRHAAGEVEELCTIANVLEATPTLPTRHSELTRIIKGEGLAPRDARAFMDLAGCTAIARRCVPPEDKPLVELVREPIEALRTRASNHRDQQSSEEAPRNAAFELFAGCLFKKVGVGIRKVEPDWLLEFEGEPIALAAKRIQSTAALRGKADEGAAQIRRAQERGAADCGVVAIDLSLAFDLHRKHWVIERLADAHELQQALTTILREQRNTAVEALTDRPYVGAVILHLKAMIFILESQTFLTTRVVLPVMLFSSGHHLARCLGQLQV